MNLDSFQLIDEPLEMTVAHPVTGKTEKNVDQAKFLIDTLSMLKDKTKGNLNPHELLEALLGVPAERAREIPVTRTALHTSRDTSQDRPRGPALKRR